MWYLVYHPQNYNLPNESVLKEMWNCMVSQALFKVVCIIYNFHWSLSIFKTLYWSWSRFGHAWVNFEQCCSFPSFFVFCTWLYAASALSHQSVFPQHTPPDLWSVQVLPLCWRTAASRGRCWTCQTGVLRWSLLLLQGRGRGHFHPQALGLMCRQPLNLGREATTRWKCQPHMGSRASEIEPAEKASASVENASYKLEHIYLTHTEIRNVKN